MKKIRERILARRDLDAARAARDITALAAALNAEGFTAPQQRFITARAVLAGCADGAQILDKLEAAASVSSEVKWAVRFLGLDAGIDIGDPYAQATLDKLALGNVLTPAEAGQVKTLAFQLVIVSVQEVADEMFNPDGTEK